MVEGGVAIDIDTQLTTMNLQHWWAAVDADAASLVCSGLHCLLLAPNGLHRLHLPPRHNTALHMCVYHDQMDMYDHLVEFCGASENVRNNRGQTPLLLAASLGKVEMFQHIYNKRRKVAWAYGPVSVGNVWRCGRRAGRRLHLASHPGLAFVKRVGHAGLGGRLQTKIAPFLLSKH